MNLKFLVFRIYAPIQSWGDVSPGVERSTWRTPSRSALVGLFGAALGLDRNSEELIEFHKSLRFAIRIDSKNLSDLVDFHTSQIPSGGMRINRACEVADGQLNTVLSNRSYLCDGVFSIAVWSESDGFIGRILHGLHYPQYNLYLGRKSCPLAFPLNAKVIEATDAADALILYGPPPKELEKITKKSGSPVEIVSDLDPINGFVPFGTQYRRDCCVDANRRLFVEREEISSHAVMP